MPMALLKRSNKQSARVPKDEVVASVADGKLLPAKQSKPFKPFKPVRVKGKAVSRLIIEERR